MRACRFKEVDDAILAAYKHVKLTGFKFENFANDEIIGLWSDDNYVIYMSIHDHTNSYKRDLARRIHAVNVPVVELINRQLMVFL